METMCDHYYNIGDKFFLPPNQFIKPDIHDIIHNKNCLLTIPPAIPNDGWLWKLCAIINESLTPRVNGLLLPLMHNVGIINETKIRRSRLLVIEIFFILMYVSIESFEIVLLIYRYVVYFFKC